MKFAIKLTLCFLAAGILSGGMSKAEDLDTTANSGKIQGIVVSGEKIPALGARVEIREIQGREHIQRARGH